MYIIGAYLSIKCLFNKEDKTQSTLYFFLSILGIGLFSYYQGRSHDLVLIPVSYPSIILAGMYADRLLTKWKDKSILFPLRLFFIAIIFFMINSLFITYQNYPILISHISKGFESISNLNHKTELMENIDFIRLLVVFGEKVFIIVQPRTDGLYYGYSNTRCAINNLPGSTERIVQSDNLMIFKFLNTNKLYKVFCDYSCLDPQTIRILANKYHKIQENQHGMQLLLPNQGKCKL